VAALLLRYMHYTASPRTNEWEYFCKSMKILFSGENGMLTDAPAVGIIPKEVKACIHFY
jgi:hypothetical protein